MVASDLRDNEALASFEVSESDLLVVISQSCDVQSNSIELEPRVEFYLARVIPEPNGNNTFGKNPRVLDISATVRDESISLRFSQIERVLAPRQVLLDRLPLDTLPEETVRLIAGWTGARYTRPALPNEFNRRRKPSATRVGKVAKTSARDVTAIYIGLIEDAELSADDPYHVLILGTVLPLTAADVDAFERSIKSVAEIAAALNDCPGIDVIDVETKAEDDVSLFDRRSLIRLDLDSYSVSDRAGSNMEERLPSVENP